MEDFRLQLTKLQAGFKILEEIIKVEMIKIQSKMGIKAIQKVGPNKVLGKMEVKTRKLAQRQKAAQGLIGKIFH